MKKIYTTILLIIFSVFLVSCKGEETENKYFRLSFGDNINSITRNIKLKNNLDDNNIKWESDNKKYISNTGVVTRPDVLEDNVVVTLTATIENETKTFKFTVRAKTGNKISDDYPVTETVKHQMKDVNYEELLDIFKNKKTAIVYLGFPECPDCQEYIYYFVKALGNKELISYNMLSIRRVEEDGDYYKLNSDFENLISYIDDEFLVPNPQYTYLKWLYAPTIMKVVDGKVVSLHTNYYLDHIPGEGAMTKEMQKDFIKYLKNLLK